MTRPSGRLVAPLPPPLPAAPGTQEISGRSCSSCSSTAGYLLPWLPDQWALDLARLEIRRSHPSSVRCSNFKVPPSVSSSHRMSSPPSVTKKGRVRRIRVRALGSSVRSRRSMHRALSQQRDFPTPSVHGICRTKQSRLRGWKQFDASLQRGRSTILGLSFVRWARTDNKYGVLTELMQAAIRDRNRARHSLGEAPQVPS